jgi:hypothetical protein
MYTEEKTHTESHGNFLSEQLIQFSDAIEKKSIVREETSKRANLQTTGTIYNKETQLLAYADDIDIDGRSQSAVRGAYLAMKIEAAKVELKINEQKTKYRIAARNDRTIRDVGQSVTIRDVEQSVTIGDKHFEVVKNLCTYT